MTNLWVTPEELGPYAESEFAYEAAKSASNLLWALSGRKYSGITTVTERYVCASRRYRYGASIRNSKAELINGEVYNIPSSDIDFYYDITSDGTAQSARLRLRGRPVTKIHSIRNRLGKIINPSQYYLVDHSTIQAVSGVPWTPCDVEVTYTYGIEPPSLGKMAARTLAIEFAKLWAGDDDCMLPQRVTSVSRQGVSYTLLDSQDFIDDMRTGIYVVDLFLKSVNPDKARAKARVFTPDLPRARRYAPKELKYGTSDLDIEIVAQYGDDVSGSTTVTIESIDAEFLTEEFGWTPYATIYNYSGTKSLELDPPAVEIITSDTEIKITVGYEEARGVIGLVDPGSWDLYASRTNGEETEIVSIASGNLVIKLATTSVNAYTLGQ
jgi:hypothetical protein